MKEKDINTRIYNNIFELNYLIKYGYYDISLRNKNHIRENTYLYEVSEGASDAFFTRIFNMDFVANFIKNMDSNDKEKFFNIDENKLSKYKATEPIYFSIPKNISNRRLYKLPNIYSYLLLAFFVNRNKNNFVKIFKDNKFSTSKFFNFYTFPDTNELREKLLYLGIKHLHLDLSNFYHTLYTHSIPWIIDGKSNAKNNQNGGFGNNLDTLIRKCQYDETYGVPTGNLISRIITELYMCYFDEKMAKKGFKYSRYVDDICFSYSFENEAIEFLTLFRKICKEHNLMINESKTRIESFPFEDKCDKTKIFDYFDDINENASIKKWIEKIRNFINYCISAESMGNKGAIKCMFEVLRKLDIEKNKLNDIFSYYSPLTKFNIFEKILDISLKDSKLTNRFMDLVETLQKKGFQRKNSEEIINEYFKNNKEKYQKKIDYYFKNNCNQELYQILLLSIEFHSNVLFDKNKLKELISFETDDFSLVLATILFYRIEKKLEELLPKIDKLFIETNKRYTEQPIMAQQFWFYRYFIYFIMKKNNNIYKEIEVYCESKKYKKNKKCTKEKKVYDSELFWEYKKNNPSGKINDFYDKLFENEVELVILKGEFLK